MTVALIAAGAFIAACVQATTGIGFALILTPVLFALLSPVGAIVAATALGLVLNLLVLLTERRRPQIAWAEVVPILVAAVPGSICGLLLLRALPKPVLQVCVGIAVIGAGLLRLRGTVRVSPGGRWRRLGLGFTTGTLSTSTGVNGPPLALWLTSRGLRPAKVRDSLSAMFLGSGLITIVTLTPVLGRAHIGPVLLAAAFVCVVAGHAIGSRAFARLDTRRFDALLLAVILASGAASVAAGLNAL